MKLRKYYNVCRIWAALLVVSGLTTSCEKFIDIGNPKTEVISKAVFASNEAATAGMMGIYASMRGTWAGGSYNSVTARVSFSADEMDGSGEYFSNNLLPTSNHFWSPIYKDIYAANAMLEGLNKPNGLSEAVRNQLIGEAKFLRAFCYFYLVNFFGDVPLVNGTDWEQNTNVTRTPKEQVYKQIVADLKDAQELLPVDYTVVKNKRSRPIKWTAAALLARVYLYLEQWPDAEAQASTVIANTALYGLPALNQVFLITSKEAIWQISSDNGIAEEANIFSPTPMPPYQSSLWPSTAAKFEPGDQRLTYWITKVGDLYYPTKYKDNRSADGITEYSMVMRLAEQYLIRAEARARQDKLTDAVEGVGNSAESDLNAVRTRAGLAGTDADTKSSMLLAIEDERLRELYTEWGHRWLDLKRTNRATAVLEPIKPGWNETKELFPIPAIQFINDPAMEGQQNPGY